MPIFAPQTRPVRGRIAKIRLALNGSPSGGLCYMPGTSTTRGFRDVWNNAVFARLRAIYEGLRRSAGDYTPGGIGREIRPFLPVVPMRSK